MQARAEVRVQKFGWRSKVLIGPCCMYSCSQSEASCTAQLAVAQERLHVLEAQLRAAAVPAASSVSDATAHVSTLAELQRELELTKTEAQSMSSQVSPPYTLPYAVLVRATALCSAQLSQDLHATHGKLAHAQEAYAMLESRAASTELTLKQNVEACERATAGLRTEVCVAHVLAVRDDSSAARCAILLMRQVQAKDTALAELKQQLQEALAQLEIMNGRLAELASKHSSLQRQLTESDRQLRASQRVHADSQSDWRKLDSAKEALLASVRQELARAQADLQQSSEECVRREAALAALRMQAISDARAASAMHAQR